MLMMMIMMMMMTMTMTMMMMMMLKIIMRMAMVMVMMMMIGRWWEGDEERKMMRGRWWCGCWGAGGGGGRCWCWGGRPIPRPGSGKQTLCKPAQSKCTWAFHRSHFVWKLKFTRKMPDANPATLVLCEPAQSKCTRTCHKRHSVRQLTGKMPDASDTTSIEHRALTPTVRTPQCGHTVLGIKQLLYIMQKCRETIYLKHFKKRTARHPNTPQRCLLDQGTSRVMFCLLCSQSMPLLIVILPCTQIISVPMLKTLVFGASTLLTCSSFLVVCKTPRFWPIKKDCESSQIWARLPVFNYHPCKEYVLASYSVNTYQPKN